MVSALCVDLLIFLFGIQPNSRARGHMTHDNAAFFLLLLLGFKLLPFRVSPTTADLLMLQIYLIRSFFGRSSVDEEVARLDDGHSDDDILANSSDEEEDSSSVSSKGEAERPEESRVRRRPADSVLHFGEFDAFLIWPLLSDAGEAEE